MHKPFEVLHSRSVDDHRESGLFVQRMCRPPAAPRSSDARFDLGPMLFAPAKHRQDSDMPEVSM